MTRTRWVYIIGFLVLILVLFAGVFYLTKGFSSFSLSGSLGNAEPKAPTELVIRDIIEGESAAASEPGQLVVVSYIARLEDDTIFENVPDTAPISFTLGNSGEVIPGLEKGVYGMRLNGLRIITVPPELGYGKKGKPGLVPPNETLTYEIQLLRLRSVD